ncbi:mitochondrial inner membrane protein required for protein import [Malassezia yamatoensis]|uniref:Mitochondrial import inner membrane translocase subunit TIM50 n=1 Tax=Malassezia yamatoensis TaxID=253288 RepID=A0AAJ6CHI8_9BASI|nr:mitochondrial inner membrane protein required for protein import [Malassezia yamatoensis]
MLVGGLLVRAVRDTAQRCRASHAARNPRPFASVLAYRALQTSSRVLEAQKNGPLDDAKKRDPDSMHENEPKKPLHTPEEKAWQVPSEPENPVKSAEAPKAKTVDNASQKESTPVHGEIPKGGIPLDIDSTSILDQEALESPKDEENTSMRRTNAKSRSKGSSSIEKNRNFVVRLMLVGTTLFAGYGVWMMGRDLDEREHELFHDQEDMHSFLGRIKLRYQALRDGITKPVWEKLLPDPLPFPYSRPYTLVLDLDQLLVSSQWSTNTGWRTAKRPGLDYFLGYLSQWYEIVIFTTQPFYVVEKIIEKLDPDRRYIAYQLFRESCLQKDGKLIKDLTYLNRDPRRVIMIDTNPEHVSMQPENAILLPPWHGEKGDRDLVGLIPFLDAIGIYGVDDVRRTLKAYEGKHIPSEHAKNEQLLKQRHEEEWHAKKQRLGGLSSMFGSISSGQAMTNEPPPMLVELERARYNQGYLEDQKFWQENGEKLRKQMQEEQEKQLREMKLNAWEGVTRMFGGGAPPPTPGSDTKPAEANAEVRS